jgi:16S rRNA (cytidine1402-2'-O)-methyltransferase
LALSGLPTQRFTFEGFLSTSKKSRFEHLESLKNEKRTMIFHEAPHKLIATLHDMCDTFGPDRKISLCRELTKLHEEVLRMTLGQAAEYYDSHPPKGEFVLVLEGASQEEKPQITLSQALEMVIRLRDEGKSLKEACKICSAQTGIAKNVLYDAAVKGTKD